MVRVILSTTVYLPQLIKTWKSKSAEDISWSMLVRFFTGIFLWLIYGTSIHDVPVICANMVILVLASIILIFKIRFRYLRELLK